MTEGASPLEPRGNPRVSAIVLAAGLASRMGGSKSLVRLAGKPLLDHVLEHLAGSRVFEVIVVLGHDASLVRSGAELRGVRVVLNPNYRGGMSTSIRAGLRAAQPAAGAYLLVLGDQPFVDSATLDRLIDAWSRGDGTILIPTFRGRRGNPVLIDHALAREADSLEGDTGFRGLFEHHARSVREVPVDDPGVLFDVDTPEQVRELERRLGKGVPLVQAIREIVAPGNRERRPP